MNLKLEEHIKSTDHETTSYTNLQAHLSTNRQFICFQQPLLQHINENTMQLLKVFLT